MGVKEKEEIVLYHPQIYPVSDKGSPLDLTVKSLVILAASHPFMAPFIFSPDIVCALKTPVCKRDFK